MGEAFKLAEKNSDKSKYCKSKYKNVCFVARLKRKKRKTFLGHRKWCVWRRWSKCSEHNYSWKLIWFGVEVEEVDKSISFIFFFLAKNFCFQNCLESYVSLKNFGKELCFQIVFLKMEHQDGVPQTPKNHAVLWSPKWNLPHELVRHFVHYNWPCRRGHEGLTGRV